MLAWLLCITNKGRNIKSDDQNVYRSTDNDFQWITLYTNHFIVTFIHE